MDNVTDSNLIYFYSVQKVTNINESYGYVGEGAENYYNHNNQSPCGAGTALGQLCCLKPDEWWSFKPVEAGLSCDDGKWGNACGKTKTIDGIEIEDQVWSANVTKIGCGCGNDSTNDSQWQICCSKPNPLITGACPAVGGKPAIRVDWNSTVDKTPIWRQDLCSSVGEPYGGLNRIVKCYYERSNFTGPKEISFIRDFFDSKITNEFNNEKDKLSGTTYYRSTEIESFKEHNVNAYYQLMGDFCAQPAQNECVAPYYFPPDSACGSPTGCSMFNDVVNGQICKTWALQAGPTGTAANIVTQAIANYCSKHPCSPDCLCQNAGEQYADSYVDPFYSAMIQLSATYPGVRQPYCWYLPCINPSGYYLENLGAGGKDPRSSNTDICDRSEICGQINNIINGNDNNYNFSDITQYTNCGREPDSGGNGDSAFYSFWKNYKWIIIAAVSIISLIILVFIIIISINHVTNRGERNVTPATSTPYQ
jgi:hypothetical protein